MELKVTYNQIIDLIQNLNSFIEEMDNKILLAKNNYDSRINQTLKEHDSSAKVFEANCNKQIADIQANAKRMMDNSIIIKNKIEEIDKHLSSVDKYYQKTKTKKMEELASKKSDKYSSNEDYISALKKIQEDFSVISDKYATDILPSVLNGLNYFFSSKRKKDYEELIILNNTVNSFIEEMDKNLKEITDETIEDMKKQFNTQKEQMICSQKMFKNKLEQEYNNTLINIAGEIEERFNNVMPEELLKKLKDSMNNYKKGFGNINTTNSIYENEFYIGYIEFPINDFIQSTTLKSFIREKCADIIVNNAIRLPYALDLGAMSNVLLSYNEKQIDKMQKIMHNAIWNFLSTVPVTKSNIIITDCDKKGSNILPFLNFKKEQPDTFDGNIYTNEDDVYNRLKKLNDQIDDVIQNKLINRYSNIIEYNKNAPTRSEALNLLVIFDFPSGFSGRCIELLNNIIKNGGKCGIYTIIGYNKDMQFDSFNKSEDILNKILTYSSYIDIDQKYYLKPYYLEVCLENTLDYESANNFIEQYKMESNAIKNKSLSFDDILDKELFTRDSTKELVIPVGVGDGESIVSMSFGKGSSHHALIAGATGSGKSTLLHTLIMSAMLSYSPDMLNLYLMDFKGGTEFKIYDSFKLPHIKLLALDAMQEFGESILENLVAEIGKRSNEFKDANVSKLSEYAQVTGKKLPRILIIMDEFQILFNDATNRKVANHCAELVKRIVTEGRSYGIHLLMATQSTKIIGGLTIEKGTIEQMRIRVGLKCGDYDANYLFTDRNDRDALEKMKGPIGTAVLNQEYTENDNIGFRAAYCDDERQERYLKQIEEKYKDVPTDTQSFEGRKVTSLLSCLSYNAYNPQIEIQVGSLIKVAPPFNIVFDKKKKHNTLICGTNEKIQNNIFNLYLLQCLLNKNADVYCIDSEKIIGEELKVDYYKQYERFGNRFNLAQNKGDIIKFVNKIYDFYLESKKELTSTQKVLFIKNFEYLDLLKQMIKGDKINEEEYVKPEEKEEEKVEEKTTEDGPQDLAAQLFSIRASSRARMESTSSSLNQLNVSKKLIQLIEDGSTYGIYIVFSSMEFQSVKECMRFGENVLNKIPERYVFSISDSDADYLIENVSVSALNDNTVYYTDTVKNKFQVKPYIFPEVQELKNYLDEIGI